MNTGKSKKNRNCQKPQSFSLNMYYVIQKFIFQKAQLIGNKFSVRTPLLHI